MASFVAIDWSDEKHNEHGSGTDTTMDKYDEQTCICMWGELAEKESLQSFGDLITLWYRNLEEYVVTGTGTVASGELPFAVQFLSPGWLPGVKVKELKILREHFCAIDETTKKRERRALTSSALSYNTRLATHTHSHTRAQYVCTRTRKCWASFGPCCYGRDSN